MPSRAPGKRPHFGTAALCRGRWRSCPGLRPRRVRKGTAASRGMTGAVVLGRGTSGRPYWLPAACREVSFLRTGLPGSRVAPGPVRSGAVLAGAAARHELYFCCRFRVGSAASLGRMRGGAPPGAKIGVLQLRCCACAVGRARRPKDGALRMRGLAPAPAHCCYLADEMRYCRRSTGPQCYVSSLGAGLGGRGRNNRLGFLVQRQ